MHVYTIIRSATSPNGHVIYVCGCVFVFHEYRRQPGVWKPATINRGVFDRWPREPARACRKCCVWSLHYIHMHNERGCAAADARRRRPRLSCFASVCCAGNGLLVDKWDAYAHESSTLGCSDVKIAHTVRNARVFGGGFEEPSAGRRQAGSVIYYVNRRAHAQFLIYL